VIGCLINNLGGTAEFYSSSSHGIKELFFYF